MSITIDLDDLITNKEAATLLAIKPNTLEIWRHQGKGPPCLKLGDAAQSTVRYQRSAVVAWAKTRAFTSTSAASVAAAKAAAAAEAKEAVRASHALRIGEPGAIPGPWTGTIPANSPPSDAT